MICEEKMCQAPSFINAACPKLGGYTLKTNRERIVKKGEQVK
jgi:hypothetical protein